MHHLGEDRGATLETVVVRMRLLNQVYIDKIAEGKTEEERSKYDAFCNSMCLIFLKQYLYVCIRREQISEGPNYGPQRNSS